MLLLDDGRLFKDVLGQDGQDLPRRVVDPPADGGRACDVVSGGRSGAAAAGGTSPLV